MDPKALWEQMVASSEKILRLTSEIAKNEEVGISPSEMDWAELNDEADSLAMDVSNLKEWIDKGGFSPFQEQREQRQEEEMLELEEEDLEFFERY